MDSFVHGHIAVIAVLLAVLLVIFLYSRLGAMRPVRPHAPLLRNRWGAYVLALAVILGSPGMKPAAAQFPEVAAAPYAGPPAYCQLDNRWKDRLLGFSKSYTIGGYGCAITALAMLLSWYGVPTDSGGMNDWLKANGGFANQADVIWEVAARRAPNVTYLGKDDWQTKPAVLGTVNDEIDNGFVTIAEVRLGKSTHFVLIVGRTPDSSNYYIIDPWTGQRKTLCPSFGTKPTTAIYGLRKFRLKDVGQGSVSGGPQRRLFIDAFYRAGGRGTLQAAVDSVHGYGNSLLQDFTLDGRGSRAVVDGGLGVYAVYGGIGILWFQSGGPYSSLLAPRSDESDAAPSFRGTWGRFQRFGGGSIWWCPNYGAQPVLGGIAATFEAYGGTGGRLGFPTGPVWDWYGYKRQDFEGGCILMDRQGNRLVYFW